MPRGRNEASGRASGKRRGGKGGKARISKKYREALRLKDWSWRYWSSHGAGCSDVRERRHAQAASKRSPGPASTYLVARGERLFAKECLHPSYTSAQKPGAQRPARAFPANSPLITSCHSRALSEFPLRPTISGAEANAAAPPHDLQHASVSVAWPPACCAGPVHSPAICAGHRGRLRPGRGRGHWHQREAACRLVVV